MKLIFNELIFNLMLLNSEMTITLILIQLILALRLAVRSRSHQDIRHRPPARLVSMQSPCITNASSLMPSTSSLLIL